MEMTQQYLIGELSLLLAQLQAVATNRSCAHDVACLRHEAETGPLARLTPIAVRALELTERQCWDSLSEGDTAAFASQAAVSAQLHEFGVSAGLLGEA